MKKIYFFLIAAMYVLMPADIFAQSNKDMTIYFKDQHKQAIPVNSIDSIKFETHKNESKDFIVTLDKISELYAEYTIIPKDPSMTYNVMVEERELIESYPSDDAIFADDKLFFQQLADGYEITLPELLEYFLISDEFHDFSTGIVPDRDYIMYVYGMTPDGERTTEMLKIPFTTQAAQHIDNKIDIQASLEGDVINATFTPDDDSRHYTAGIFNADDVMDYDKIGEKIQISISEAIVDYILGDEPLSEYLNNRTSKGKSNGKFIGGDPNGTYYVVAAYLDDNCGICSDVTIKTVGEGAPAKTIKKRSMAQFNKRTRMLDSKFTQLRK